MMHRGHQLAALTAMTLGLAVPAAAQAPAVGFVYPGGAQAGAKSTLSLNGGNLQGATGLLVSGEGVQAQIAKNDNASALPIEVTVAPNAVPGLRELRVVTPRGVSNPARIWVSSYPDVNEAEPNNTVLAPQKVDKLPAVLNGQVNGGEDVDNFAFQAQAGETFVFDLVAAQMASALDGYLALYDARGKIVASAQDAFDRDPRIIHTFKTAGTYVIQVRDTLYRGGGNFVYRLTAGKVPVVTGYLPRGGKRGQTVNVTLEGANLGSMAAMPVALPMDRDEVTVPLQTPMGMSANTVSLSAGDMDEAVEAEPNDGPPQATAVATLPVVLNGKLDKAGDVDLYRIKPAAAANFSFEIWGRRLGSRIDSFLRILDATGKPLSENDDAAGKDSRIVMGVQANTEYLVEVKGLDRRSGGDVFYRLVIGVPGGQDFNLTVTPNVLNVGQTGSTAVTVNVARLNGFGGKVDLRLEGLPAGVVASPAFIPAGAGAAQFTLTAAGDAPPGVATQPRIIGSAVIDGKTVERVARPIEIYRLPLAADGQDSRRECALLPAAVMPPTAYSLDLETKAVTAKKGTDVQIKVKALRQMGQTAQINLTVAGQPANVAPQLANIAANAGEAVITLKVAANAPEVTQNVIITGNMNNNIQVAPAFTLTIVP
jgi:hypothetical protein